MDHDTIRISEQSWQSADASCVVRSPGQPADVTAGFPTRWRVFGPLPDEHVRIGEATRGACCEPLVSVGVDQLRAIPETLTVGQMSLTGRDVDVHDGTLDFDAILGGHNRTPGHQAYALAEIEVAKAGEVLIGAGGDFWMQWWIDGMAVLNNLANGNAVMRIGPADHCFRHTLSAGRHVIALRSISGGAGRWHVRLGTVSPVEEMLATRDRGAWEFMPETDMIRPPYESLDGRLAILADTGWAEETIACTFVSTDTNVQHGIVFGAQDHTRFYWAYVPRWSQNFRARALHAAIALFDGGNYPRVLAMMLMPNVETHTNTPLSLRVERRGSHIQLSVNGVRGPSAVDETYGPGRVGLLGAGDYLASGFSVDGERRPDTAWNGDVTPRPLWTCPVETAADAHGLAYWQPCRCSGGDILTGIVGYRSPDGERGDKGNPLLLRSHDGGVTWERLGQPEIFPGGVCIENQPGCLRAVIPGPALTGQRKGLNTCRPDEFVSIRDSDDKGLTWGPAQPGAITGDWSGVFLEGFTFDVASVLRLHDGGLLIVLVRQCPGFADRMPGFHTQLTWTIRMSQPYATRSDDGGLTWQAPAPMDNAVVFDGDCPAAPCCDFTETPIAQLPGGRIVAVARPFGSPFAWHTHSDDGGRSWCVARYMPFSIAGNPQLVATQSGYLVVVGRGIGGTTLYVSTDGGLNWDDGWIVDHPSGFNGFMIEAEPDVVLIVYAVVRASPEDLTPSMVRAHRIRITPQGVVPAE